MILNLPSVTDLPVFDNFFILKIEDKETAEALSCDVIEILDTHSYGVPQFPVDINTFVGDTIYTNPYTLSVRVWVYESSKMKFESQLNTSQARSGFIVYGLNDIYDNLRLSGYNVSENSEVQGGYFYNLEFVEVITIEAGLTTMPVKLVKKAGDSSPVDKGIKTTKQKEKTALKGFLS